MKNQNNTLTDSIKSKQNTSLTNRGVLVVLSSNFLGHSYIINKTKTVIGRSEECDIVINDPAVSKEHCIIYYNDDDKFNIEDLGSKNLTILNNKEVKKRTHISYGDKIILGQTICRFYLEEKFETKG
jgi:pSer/pThr/pTyr-binding forkhead associated (FHA) protein